MIKVGNIVALLLILAGTHNDSVSPSFELSKDSASIIISGTSTLHDWKMYVKTFDCYADFVMEGYQLMSIESVKFVCKATDLQSDNSLMDKKAYSALKSKTFPEIKFNMISAMDVLPDDNKFRGDLTGDLSIAGKSVVISIPLNGRINIINGTTIINVNGETELKMSDFNISPPTFMMGVLKTGDSVNISFSLQFLQKSGQ